MSLCSYNYFLRKINS